jgi:hypothetical protein
MGPIVVGGLFLAGALVSAFASWWTAQTAPVTASVSRSEIEPAEASQGEPLWDSARDVSFPDDLEVLGVSAGGEDRAYLLGTLARAQHHVLNDLVNRTAVSVTYCDRTNCARVFTGGEDGRALSLRAAGFSTENGMLLDSGSGLYFQKSDRPVAPGTTVPAPYRELASVRTTWGEWRDAHPGTSVAYYPCLATDNWQQVFPSRQVVVPPGEPVVGLTLNGCHRAYLLRAFRRADTFVTRDSLDDTWVTVVHSLRRKRTRALVAMRREVDAAPLTFGGWDVRTGEMILAYDGLRYDGETHAPRDGADRPSLPFREVALVTTTWGRWSEDHPDTTVNVGEFRDLVHPPRVDGVPLLCVESLATVLPFVPGMSLLLVLVASRYVRRRRGRWGRADSAGEVPPA